MARKQGPPHRPGPGPGSRLGRAERREQILAVATEVFARAGGFAATGLDDIAREAGVTRMILYRHFESKHDLYGAVLERAGERLYAATTTDQGELSEQTVPAMIEWAARDPSAFRLLFQYAAREPEFRDQIDELRAGMIATAYPHITDEIAEPAWARWATQLATAVITEAITAWLDAGQPDPDHAAARILHTMDGVDHALRTHGAGL